MKKAPLKTRAPKRHDPATHGLFAVGDLVGSVSSWAASRVDVAGVCINLMPMAPNNRMVLDVRVKGRLAAIDEIYFVFVEHFDTVSPPDSRQVRKVLDAAFAREHQRLAAEIEAGLAEPPPPAKPEAKARAKAKAPAKKKGGAR